MTGNLPKNVIMKKHKEIIKTKIKLYKYHISQQFVIITINKRMNINSQKLYQTN